MQIDRSNYEIWFIDWLDGNLNSLQVQHLKQFLNENPGLREEFNDLTPLNLVPFSTSFRNKEHLKKSPSDILPSQFEYLCTAFVENDLSDNQMTELKEIVDSYPDKKKTFDLVQKTRLIPPSVSFRHKSRLMKRTVFQKVIRLSVLGLSAAAAIALIIITYSVLPGNTSLKNNSSAQNFVSDSTLQKPSQVTETERISTDIIPLPAEQKRESSFSKTLKADPVITNSDLISAHSDESLVRKTDNQEITVDKVPVHTQIDLNNVTISNTLIALNTIIYIPEVEDERNKAGRFFSKTFREIFLKEKPPTDTPLKGYEIAEAGVTGLNKLFGWEMALDKRNDDNGQLKSVYFSSKILKFNAPVKKSEPLP
jgi:hypothetical protein